ncbi:HD-GYP domain-containing protein [Anaerobacillus sp. MEB173]|uniref:HD-GYP domain-containing protein n=1 Tax=Anaerobacillus sp. MEB173 TaxID=3383345 RepID=UPI003F9150A6
MRLITIDQYDPKTMQLAKPIFDNKRRVLLAAGNNIHPKYMAKLIQLGLSHLIIEDKKSEGITLEEMIDMPTWMDLIGIMNKTYQEAASRRPLPLRDIQQTAGKLITEVQKRKAIMLVPSSSIANELTHFAHVVNVTLLALQIGKQLKYNNIQLRDLAIGCLLHDIGKAVTNKEEEHPKAGFDLIRNNREINLLSAHIAYQHHETLDGRGFPRSLNGNDILQFAQICNIANSYENLISTNKLSPDIAAEQIMSQSETKFLHTIVLSFMKGVALYPPGTNVLLNTGHEAIVTRIEGHLQRPVVRLHSLKKEIDLAENPTIIISRTKSSDSS